ncbi:hypothetical protein OWV82_006345 [Melia azedarach]|uniref:Uncharacterized protein n=1 Tax=Melia azedarach TaxID=155640 RepID=A0ACC1YIE4_MELAZ|nr:hypothetical protein OWV82_006345 [Melia azedarach]
MDEKKDHFCVVIPKPKKPMDEKVDKLLIDSKEPKKQLMDKKKEKLPVDSTELEPEILMDGERDNLAIDISQRLDLVSKESKEFYDGNSSAETSFKFCIPRVPMHLRDLNGKAYEPQIIAIGPYFPRDKPHFGLMEEQKLRCLEMLVRRTGDPVEKYLKRMRELAESALACYADPVYLTRDQFVEMLLFDACFIVEQFRCWCGDGELKLRKGKEKNPVFDSCWICKKLACDLLLAENQLPFFVLWEFFKMTGESNEPDSFLEIIPPFFVSLLPRGWNRETEGLNIKEIKHLLSFIHDLGVYPLVRTMVTEGDDWEFMRCATELQEAGIKFTMTEQDSLLKIKFENGTMEIPRLRVDYETESFFRNLIVYEQFYPKDSVPFTDYIKFMDCLVNSGKDVQLLCRRKILHNCLGDDEMVANMFNRLLDSVPLSSCNRYKNIYMDVNKHCSRRQNRWMANLRRNYFNTPWAFISFLAAVLLLLLTLAQTVFSVLAYFKSDRSPVNI